MKKLFTIAFLVLVYTKIAFAQVFFTNDGAIVTLTPGSFIYVQGSVVNQDSGTFDNSGTINLMGDWTNNAGNFAFINSSPGSVILSGDTQNIQGTSVTKFYDLILQGTGVKVLKTDAIVEDSLALNDRELATDTFTMLVTSTNTGAVTRTTGFVSSLGNGSLSRNTAILNKYLFPVGSSIGTPRYRPVEITPTAASPVYSVRMANADPTTEGFDRTLKDSSLCLINPDFYHRINSSGADSADITIYFDDSLDNAYQAIAHWQNVPQWENTGAVTLISNVSPILSSITRSLWTDFSYVPFALAAPMPVVSLSNSASAICVGDTVIFTATPGFTNYTFFVNSNTVQNGTDSIYTTASVSSGDTISVVITTVGCNAKSNEITSIIVNPLPVVNLGTDTIVCGSAILNASNAGATFNWSTTDTTQTIIADTTDTYWVDVTNTNGCTTRDSINVTVNPAPLVYLGADTTLCGGTVPLDAGNAGAAFTWSTTDTTQTIIVDSTSIYWVDVSDTATGCTTRDSIEVTINSLPIKSLGTDTSACGSHTLDAGNSGALFSWSTTDTSQTIVVNTTNTYWVDVTIGGCTTRDSIDVTINPSPAANITPVGATTLCSGDTVELQSDTANTYLWLLNGSGTGLTSQSIYVSTSGDYQVVVSNIAGCTDTSTIETITVNPLLPIANFGHSGSSLTVTFTDSSVNETMWVWNFGDGNTDTVQNPVHTYAIAGSYNVCLIAGNACGSDSICDSVTAKVIKIQLFIPNAFSPNGDGENDVFRVIGSGIKKISLVVYNRWGEEVFETKDIKEATEIGWDGKHNGEEQGMAVFVYYLEVEFEDGTPDIRKGDVTLIR
ncbi:MAG: T9SS type B sorting domain-containing protein [Cytophagales bacterium]|nr:T9SS type B sorting domain-containing protein [Cytophagales bacterium]